MLSPVLPDRILVVVDEAGRPIRGAYDERAEESTESNDRGRLPIFARGRDEVTVSAEGRERKTVEFPPGPTGGEQRVVLRPSAPLRVRVIDAAGRPVPGVSVDGDDGGGGVSDARGRALCAGYTEGWEVTLWVSPDGCWPATTRAIAGGPEATLTLGARSTIRVRLVDRPGATASPRPDVDVEAL